MCNISGALKNDTKKFHNIDVLRYLAMFGSDRGKDSFGISYNSKIDYWVREGHGGTEGNASLIFQVQPFPENIKSSIVLMHNRQATVGLVDEKGAHPYIIDDIMVGMKNGTLFNHEALGKKYNIDKSEWNTDSELLLTIINRYGTEVLREYIGGCAMAWYFLDEPNKLYLWKGASMNYNKIEEERPLWYVFDEKNKTFYFNSLKAPLRVITNCRYVVEQVPDNTLLIIQDGKIISEEFIDRSKMSQTRPYEHASTWDNSFFGRKGKNHHTTNLPAKVKVFDVNPQNNAGTKVYHYNGNYYRNGHFLDGEYIVDISTQEVLHNWDINNPSLRKFYFIRGVWIKDEATYTEICVKKNRYTTINDVHIDAFVRNVADNKWYKGGKVANFTGVPIYFGYSMYTFRDGELTACAPLQNRMNKDALLYVANKYFYDNYTSQYASTREEMEATVATWSSIKVDWSSAAALRASLEAAIEGEEPVGDITTTQQQHLLELGAWKD